MVPIVLVFSVSSVCSFLHIVVQSWMCSMYWSGWRNPDQKSPKFAAAHIFSFNGGRKKSWKLRYQKQKEAVGI